MPRMLGARLCVGWLLLALPAAACADAHSPSGPSASAGPLRAGTWGGDQTSLEVSGTGVSIEWGCASGTIDKVPQADATGKFTATGNYQRQGPGPIREDDTGQPARFKGTVTGDTLTLEVTLTNSGESIGTFTFTFGKKAKIVRCY